MSYVNSLGKDDPVEHNYRHVERILPPDSFDTLITMSVGPDGQPVAMWSNLADRDELLGSRVDRGGARFPSTRTESRPPIALTRYEAGDPRPASTTVVSRLPIANPLIQPLSRGEYLVVGSRCAWREEGPERNAAVIDADGQVRQTGTLGDGISHLLVDAEDAAWVGYFDEGIFGNYGWGGPGPEPLGSTGIVKWSTDFEKLWEYPVIDDYWLADCYALNVAPGRTLACPYDNFPILDILDSHSVAHPTDRVSGPHGLIVADNDIAIIGNYEDSGALMTGSIGRLPHLQESLLRMPDGTEPPGGALFCRGSVVNLFLGPDWFIFDLSEVS